MNISDIEWCYLHQYKSLEVTESALFETASHKVAVQVKLVVQTHREVCVCRKRVSDKLILSCGSQWRQECE